VASARLGLGGQPLPAARERPPRAVGPGAVRPAVVQSRPRRPHPVLVPGRNVIGAEVLFYGHGEGTWPFAAGVPFRLRVEEWAAHERARERRLLARPLDRAHRPGSSSAGTSALQEDFDARLRPPAGASPASSRTPRGRAPGLEVPADRPAAAGSHYDYLTDGGIDPAGRRSVRARCRSCARRSAPWAASRVGRVRWLRDPPRLVRVPRPRSFEIVDQTTAAPSGEGAWQLQPPRGRAPSLRSSCRSRWWASRSLLWTPRRARDRARDSGVARPRRPAWLDTHRFSWTRLVCREARTVSRASTTSRSASCRCTCASRGPVVSATSASAAAATPGRRPRASPARAEAAARLRGLVQHARQRGAGDDRGRMGRERQQYSGDGRTCCTPPARLRRPPTRAALPAHLPDGRRRTVLPRLLPPSTA